MIKTMVVLLLLGGLGTYAAGVRFHPEAVVDYLPKEGALKKPPQQVRLDFVSGKSLTAGLIEENPETVKVEVDGGTFTFQRNEIAGLTPVSVPVSASKPVLKRPLFTYRPEDMIFRGYQVDKKSGGYSKGVIMRQSREAIRAWEEDSRREAQQRQKAAKQKQRDGEHPYSGPGSL